MFNPLVVIIAFILLDFVVSYFSKKNVSETDIPTSEKKEKPASPFMEMIKNFEKSINDGMESEPRKTENVTEEVPVRREGTPSKTREDTIRRQEAKITRHSEMERSRRLQRDTLIRSSHLSEGRVTLAESVPKRRMRDYDLGQQKSVSIQTADLDKSKTQRDSSRRLNIREDILKGVIYSEILAKPKSLEKK